MVEVRKALVEPQIAATTQMGGMPAQYSGEESRRRKMLVARMGGGAYSPGLARLGPCQRKAR